MAMVAKTGSAMVVAATMAMAVTDKNRNCMGRQQSTKWGSGSSGDSGCGSGICSSVALTTGRGGKDEGSGNSNNSGGEFSPP
jgi:hypothetical protein